MRRANRGFLGGRVMVAVGHPPERKKNWPPGNGRRGQKTGRSPRTGGWGGEIGGEKTPRVSAAHCGFASATPGPRTREKRVWVGRAATGTSALAAVRPLAARGVRRNAAGGSAPLRLSGSDLLCRDARQWRAASRRLSAGAKPWLLFFYQSLIVQRSAAERPGLAR